MYNQSQFDYLLYREFVFQLQARTVGSLRNSRSVGGAAVRLHLIVANLWSRYVEYSKSGALQFCLLPYCLFYLPESGTVIAMLSSC